MSTIHDVSVVRHEYPSNVTGGWGEVAVEDGAVGGFMWQVRFLDNPGTYDGSTFPPSSGDMHTLVPVGTALLGTGVRVTAQVVAQGSPPLAGSIKLQYTQGTAEIGTAMTESIPFNLDATTLKATLEALPNIGEVSVSEGLYTAQPVPGVTVRVPRDSTEGTLSGAADLTRFVSPGEVIRVGGASPWEAGAMGGTNGELPLDGPGGPGRRGHVVPGSPIVTTDTEQMDRIVAGREVRIGGKAYEVTRTGAEVQQLVVASDRGNFTGAGTDEYRLSLTLNGVSYAKTSCLPFHATAAEMQAALNGLPNVPGHHDAHKGADGHRNPEWCYPDPYTSLGGFKQGCDAPTMSDEFIDYDDPIFGARARGPPVAQLTTPPSHHHLTSSPSHHLTTPTCPSQSRARAAVCMVMLTFTGSTSRAVACARTCLS